MNVYIQDRHAVYVHLQGVVESLSFCRLHMHSVTDWFKKTVIYVYVKPLPSLCHNDYCELKAVERGRRVFLCSGPLHSYSMQSDHYS